MYRGTTPTLIFKFPFSCEMMEICHIAFSQKRSCYSEKAEPIFIKQLSDCKKDGDKLLLELSEEDTLRLDDSKEVEIQLRISFGDKKAASEIFRTTVGRILEDGCLT